MPVSQYSEVALAARSAPRPAGAPRPSDLLLDGLAILITEGRLAAGPLLGRAARVFAEDDITVDEGLRWGWVAAVAAIMMLSRMWSREIARELAAEKRAC